MNHLSAEMFTVEYISRLTKLLRDINPKDIASFIQLLIEARDQDRNIFFIGNGGSAATASHFANDLALCKTQLNSSPFRAKSLCDNLSILTTIANDFGYEFIFSKQLETYAFPGDLLIALSASGHSTNVIKAVEFARARDMKIIGLSGFDGGKLKELAHVNVHVKSSIGEYGPVEDIHLVIDHLISAYFKQGI